MDAKNCPYCGAEPETIGNAIVCAGAGCEIKGIILPLRLWNDIRPGQEEMFERLREATKAGVAENQSLRDEMKQLVILIQNHWPAWVRDGKLVMDGSGDKKTRALFERILYLVHKL